jgi:lipoate-protein ligase B
MTMPAHLVLDKRVPYRDALDIQGSAAKRRMENVSWDLLWLLEHDPIFTAGRTTGASAWPLGEEARELSGIPVVQTARGGSLTYHGPGQVVGYPILRLKEYCPGPKRYVQMLEEVILRVLREWNIVGRRVNGLPGIWIEAEPIEKVASIGVRISHGITTHGFALNVDMDLSPFSVIVPCGIPSCRMTSMSRLLGHPVDVAAVTSSVASAFADVFQITWIMQSGISIESADRLAMGRATRTSERRRDDMEDVHA